MKKYDAIVYIGRFEPVHTAHVEIIKKAAALASTVIIIVGSADQPRTFKNPWNFTERKNMLVNVVKRLPEEIQNSTMFKFASNYDTIYNDLAWSTRTQDIVQSFGITGQHKVAIIGHDKDESTFYLNMFPQWEREEVGELVEPLNATDIRKIYFSRDYNPKYLVAVLPQTVFEYLEWFRTKMSDAYEQIIREREHIENYKKQFAGLLYPPIFVTTDAVVVQSGHVLMVKRRAEPGKGLWALPGGFVNAETDNSVQHAMVRELREETGIKVPGAVLIGNIRKSQVFDAKNRSARGRTITHAFYIQLPDGILPRVKGQDDAEKAKWIPIAEVRSEECFEDHYEIITTLTGV
jgi:bifunctional NMN adenylyltransferase/nudix hydrolase